MDKTLTIRESEWEDLTRKKLDWKCPTLSDVIRRLLDDSEEEY